ncbi:MAG: MFS transporter [Campylobacterales bacterium]|nr:MFS transporter [Campylobacterales bacterium]
MKKGELAIVYGCTIATICTLYAAQPIQPLFESELALTKFQAAIFTTAIMLPLGIAPIVYGYLLETFSSKQMLRTAVLLLGVLEICFSLSQSYAMLLSLRGLQGLLIPAILTSVMSYISTRAPREKVQQAISTYIGITIVGGFLGRFLSGLLSDMVGWRPFFLFLGVALVVLFALLRRLESDTKPTFAKPNKRQIMAVLSRPEHLTIYLAMFAIFFVFQAILNFMLFGALVYVASIQLFHWRTYEAFFAVMFLFCLGMFVVHSIASGYINKLTHEYKGIANGLYISFYYAGGTLGTFLPGVVYEYGGWHWFLGFLTLAVLVGASLLFVLHQRMKKGYNAASFEPKEH